MLNIKRNGDTHLLLKDIIDYTKEKEITKSYLEEILKNLLPSKNGELLINYNIEEKGIRTALFIPKYKTIDISINKLNIWLEANTKDFISKLKKVDYNTLKSHLLLFLLTHEIEHSYQYLISENIIASPNLISSAYKGLFDLLKDDDYIIPRPIKQTRKTISLILYKLKQNYYLLERNANIESTALISTIASYNNEEEIEEFFTSINSLYQTCGYTQDTKGSIEETYKEILMYDKYKKFYEEPTLSEEERIRLGLSINEETRKKLLREKF